jgi:AraC-like DNA-binding protein
MPSTAIHARSAPGFPAGFSPERPEQFTVTCDQSPLGFGAEVPGDIRCKLTSRAQLVAARRLAVSLNYMVTHLDQPMRVSTLSAMAGLSMSRFFELFKSATGDAPINWLIRVRMQRAGELLENSNLRIKEIALRVGYDDQFYFSRLFKLVHGIAPTAFRVQRETAKAQLESHPQILPFRGESLQ